MSIGQIGIGVIAFMGIIVGSLCLSRWAANPETTDLRVKAYGLLNATVGTLFLTYFMIHIFRNISN